METVHVEEATRESTGDPIYAHVVPEEGLTRAYVMGEPVTALCGFTWVPSRDPEKYPFCPDCAEKLAAEQGQ